MSSDRIQPSSRRSNSFSLADPRPDDSLPSAAKNSDPYVDPEYRSLNPRYGKSNEKPVWGLAQPLPRVVRSRMRPNREGPVRTTVEGEQKGETEPASQVDITPQHSHTDERQQPGANDTQEDTQDHFPNTWSRYREKLHEPLAEFLGTTVALLIGECGTLSAVTSNDEAGNYQSTNWTWGFGFMLGIYIAGGISGAHLNPAISIMLTIWRGFPWRRCIVYILAQLLGAVTAAGLAYSVYYDAIQRMEFSLLSRDVSAQFVTQPKTWVTSGTAFLTECVATGVIGCVILALGDDSNTPPGAGMHALIIGLMVSVLSMAFGYNTGGCFNPVRDMGPRLVALMAGYGGHTTFLGSRAWWSWGAWGATITGAILGGGVYDICVFVGGESPINYPLQRRRQIKRRWQAREWRWIKRDKEGAKDLESRI
ncbi:hypothetical protein H2201_009172 [Coniosporium apollinis]|uniref:Aquaporin-like protein n=1 Tax=Coniosporium apollinis TaxID=61459 RepID=A0ABQ9NEZ6_9PEZI|nr:hypothetical protein H2201_009172 [Coniosporium apollinis]